MKHLLVAMVLFSGAVLAQSSTVTVPPGSAPAYVPSYSRMNCAGFLTRKPVSRANLVVGGKESPNEGQFHARDLLFLQGPELKVGERYSLLRQVVDPNKEEARPEAARNWRSVGELYAEIGSVTVRSLQNGTAIASFDFSCDTAIVGDLVVPFSERSFSPRSIDPPISNFRLPDKSPKGILLGGRDFQELLSTGAIAYTDFGSSKGAKAGEYVMIVRGYKTEDFNKVDRLSRILPAGSDPDLVNPAVAKVNPESRFMNRVLGEALVLYTSPEASTVLITRSLTEMQVGDLVESELDEAGAAEAASAGAAQVPPAVCKGPTLRERLERPWIRNRCK